MSRRRNDEAKRLLSLAQSWLDVESDNAENGDDVIDAITVAEAHNVLEMHGYAANAEQAEALYHFAVGLYHLGGAS